ncbi:molybdenum cofactor biosynthesis protein MoaE [Bartonella tamiae]|uniref:Molybdopterin synthase catalytic subunit n=1 Tax=Bartonella tamiae Th239 TaxID=1094558 RepID=J0QXB0_9HYPH|nr:molybdenum cofactor biosynthesis protein MoaE [Bartonella tamiae]EJF90686.1 hypothetical protein ME5_01087 [Bartonella tamiae Th239]EJF93937.1 hypothetical protein MEG_00795 [Bartonella tamiae Th307]
MTFTIRVQSEDFNMAEEVKKLQHFNTNIGAIVTFSGYCRDEDNTLIALEIEHYPEMAKKQLHNIIMKAKEQWPLIDATLIHRFGTIPIGEQIVMVSVASSHRKAAFEAASFIMDFLKTDAPFWKKEHYKNSNQKKWVRAKKDDEIEKYKWSI